VGNKGWNPRSDAEPSVPPRRNTPREESNDVFGVFSYIAGERRRHEFTFAKVIRKPGAGVRNPDCSKNGRACVQRVLLKCDRRRNSTFFNPYTTARKVSFQPGLERTGRKRKKKKVGAEEWASGKKRDLIGVSPRGDLSINHEEKKACLYA